MLYEGLLHDLSMLLQCCGYLLSQLRHIHKEVSRLGIDAPQKCAGVYQIAIHYSLTKRTLREDSYTISCLVLHVLHLI